MERAHQGGTTGDLRSALAAGGGLAFLLLMAGGCGPVGDGSDTPTAGLSGAGEEGALNLGRLRPLSSCRAILQTHDGAADGLYRVDPDGLGGAPPQWVYCDMTTDGGGWMLMARFSQEVSVTQLPQEMYDAYFRQGLWIEGQSQGSPLSPDHDVDAFRVESLVWADFLTQGRSYRLRQSFFGGDGISTPGSLSFDASWVFEYNGYTTQNDAPEEERAWVLEDVETYVDTTGITWHRPDEITRFWLPYHEGIEGYVYTACGGYQWSLDGCSTAGDQYRRYGNAGIIGEANDYKDPAGSWMPHTNTAKTYDLVFVHQATGKFGLSAAPMTALYWIRPERGAGPGGDL